MVSSAAMMAFFEESEGHLDVAEASLLELDKNKTNPDAVNELFRAIHSLKGNAGLVGLTEIHEVSTEMESMLDQLRKNKEKAEQTDLDLLFGLLDTLQNLVQKAGEAAEGAHGKKKDPTNADAPSESTVPEKSVAAPGVEEKGSAVEDAPAESNTEKPAAPKTDDGMPVIDDGEEAEEEILSYLTFALGKETYGIDIRSVREIILSKQLTRVPNARGFVTGIMNLRGMVIPVIDAKKRLGFASLNGDSEQESLNIIIVEEEGLRTGINVDMVEDIMKFSKEMIVLSGQVLAGIDSSYVYGMGKAEEKTIVLLDTKSFCGVDEQYY